MLYTKDKNDAVSSFNLIGAEDNILSTARPGEGDAVDFYTYTKDLRESTINVVGKDGTSQKTYSYTDPSGHCLFARRAVGDSLGKTDSNTAKLCGVSAASVGSGV